jgi:hypothetical protein
MSGGRSQANSPRPVGRPPLSTQGRSWKYGGGPKRRGRLDGNGHRFALEVAGMTVLSGRDKRRTARGPSRGNPVEGRSPSALVALYWPNPFCNCSRSARTVGFQTSRRVYVGRRRRCLHVRGNGETDRVESIPCSITTVILRALPKISQSLQGRPVAPCVLEHLRCRFHCWQSYRGCVRSESYSRSGCASASC